MNYCLISCSLLILILLIKSNCNADQDFTSRAINSTGLWSKYNLIVKPTVSPINKQVISSTPESRYSPVDLPDDEDEEDEEDEDEDEDYEDSTTTQRSNGKITTTKTNKKVQDRKVKKKLRGHKIKGIKKLKKYMLPLLLAYKLKFFTLIPLLLGGLVLIVATTGFAGFFFALFAVGVGLKKD